MFGELLRRHRLAAGIAQETLSESARLSVETISALERGARQKPYLDTIALLAEALGLSAADRAEMERAASRRADPVQLPAHNLPPPLTSFVDREKVLAELNELVQSRRLITLVGTGGVGKTRAATHIGSQMVDHFTHGV